MLILCLVLVHSNPKVLDFFGSLDWFSIYAYLYLSNNVVGLWFRAHYNMLRFVSV